MFLSVGDDDLPSLVGGLSNASLAGYWEGGFTSGTEVIGAATDNEADGIRGLCFVGPGKLVSQVIFFKLSAADKFSVAVATNCFQCGGSACFLMYGRVEYSSSKTV